ncbi:hypothetical protein MSAN_00924900 [Mycena sanguinolenta]|uniref:HMG domain-containing protein n=1 Tax=Mycena sanguinolenta TaxID=230812 RepID=A0A8H7D9W4_9AGAR|nr:hypothetical protein MSAN_00924900 [Mycena sanguinolenta]
MDNHVPYISLDTPPPSPQSRIQLDDATPTQSCIQLGNSGPLECKLTTPTRKRRYAGSGTKRAEAKKPRTAPQNEMSEEGPAWDSAAEALLTGNDPVWNSPERPSNEDVDEQTQGQRGMGYLEYCENIQEEGGAFYQIGSDLFVVNGWDPQRKISKASWFHVQRTTIGDNEVVACQCSLSTPSEECVHQQFLRDNGDELFPLDASFASRVADAVLFSRQELDEGVFTNHFSSPSPNSRSLNGRVIVVYTGDDTGTGQWLCMKDSSNQGCWHISTCRDLLQKLIRVDPAATDETVVDGSSIDYSGMWQCHWLPPIISSCISASSTTGGPSARQAVSYLPISPPPWASLSTDPQLYDRAPALERCPDALRLNDISTCCCSEPRRRYDPALPVLQMKCTVYGLFRAWETPIELQACSNPRCHHRYIGPDSREHGIFNYNNRKLFAHDLLDEYTSAYTSSETPFSAWVSVVARRYELHSGHLEYPFVTAEVFRAVWFSYVKLQYLEGSMMCPHCGPCPENTIWDGVTLAFNRKHLLPSLEPPTKSQPDSIERKTTRYLPSQQLVPSKTVRRAVRRVLTGGPLTMARIKAAALPLSEPEDPNEEDDEDEDENEEDGEVQSGSGASGKRTRAQKAAARTQQELLERLQAIPDAVAGLSQVCPALGTLFELKFGEVSVIQGKVAPDVYRRLFLQITAEESVLQMTTKPALDALQVFVTNPNHRNASALVEIPVIHELLSYEKRFTSVHFRRQPLQSAGPEPPKIDEGVEKPWTETGCCYGVPKIRERPQYPKLKHDLNNDVGGKRGAKCSKFYSQYGERRLTGGIMGEGRNDVFSALITRWEKAPKRVIYDFACALGPFSLTTSTLWVTQNVQQLPFSKLIAMWTPV